MTDDGDSMFSGEIFGVPFSALAAAAALILAAAAFFLRLYGSALDCSTAAFYKKNSENDSSASKRIAKYLDNDKYVFRALTGAGLSFAMSSALVCTFGSAKVYSLLYSALQGSGYAETLSGVLLAVISAAAISLMFVVFMYLPSALGRIHSDRIVSSCAGAFSFVSAFFIPAELAGRMLAAVSVRVFAKGRKTDDEKQEQAEQEILQMVGEGEENGLIEENTKDMIENVFDFDDTKVGEIMTHRRDIVAVKDNALLTDVAEAAIKSGYSRIPVYHEDIDDIVGMIHVKELLRYVGGSCEDLTLTPELIKEAVYVPESKCCSEMFEYMTSHKTQIAVVVDEFGGTGGLITMEDLVEAIVGNIQDEFDHEEEDIRRLDENSFTVDGATPLDEIAELTGLDFEEDDNDTIAGVMLDRMGHIPKSGEHPSVVIHGTRFTVQEVSGQRISKVLVVKNKKSS